MQINPDNKTVRRLNIQQNRLSSHLRFRGADFLHQSFRNEIVRDGGDGGFGQTGAFGNVRTRNRRLPYTTQHQRTVLHNHCCHIQRVLLQMVSTPSLNRYSLLSHKP